ncbi:MAG TPA: hypothetical protein VGK67_34460 [Myxococcales bacterium]
MSPELATKVRKLKRQYALNAATSAILGLWTLVAPASFWGTLGISATDPIVQAIYGGAICGEGIINGLGVRWPLRYLVILQYMMAYKAVVVVGLVPRLLLMDSAPIAAWIVVAAWAFAGVQSAVGFPWGKWPEIVEALKSE